MDGIGECLYTAQGILMCKKKKNVRETFEAAPCNFNMKSLKCEEDNDCHDRTMSCRIMPVSVNATIKVCMPDDVQKVTRVKVPH